MKPFLILQLRPEPEVSDDEYAAILTKSGLRAQDTQRICLDHEKLPDELDLADYSGVIVGGGPGCISDPAEVKTPTEARIEAAILSLMPEVVGRDVPFMGCCYGMGALGHHLGAEVSKRRYGEGVAAVPCERTEAGRADPILADLPDRFDAFVGHKEALQDLPKGAVHLMRGEACPFQMIRYGQNVYATQFHPEADGDGVALRIRAYRDKGYFPPEEAEPLIARVQHADVRASARILRNFVARYATG
ncbi:glutamine amidotransferase class-I [Dinoroseobacter shibae DFL 12 = DSM 16493]|jgi:GMP synthase (glutamine-hydrolysing)|uniref:Glutamine amidotransferase class-I n=1 Tax=Dinoroseobacter shibae (strain DSM 16493 / NCIMB 14021 / DFL 12) TaxID=398580 RepID=A8LIR7_DINSH|nr:MULTISPECIES: glutamine amidotransferase [Dinoroseobacter]ABV93031.1 glutamine amidotransferase class-I [Dinoroseobacter shibae DFL 12 = DSM 16493]MDD9716132.1 glutamine amidotransferase [Dinoroseobacter sp. PD6]URF47963.1 glutamine amidotransferase [Dinoroseobacter shibae]URF52272.1 glutamine amidotransferase [Dinoroseobacter shibae]